MIRRYTITFALLALVSVPTSAQLFPVAEPEDVGLSSERLQRIDDVFGGYVEEGRIAGAVGIVLRHGKLVYTGAWGMRDVAASDRSEVDDIFRIASMTKPITSVAVMILFEEGRFFLTDPVGRYLPELANVPVANLSEATSADDIPTVRARRRMTIQDLLRHTSGLTYGSFSNSVVDSLYRRTRVQRQATLEEMITELGKLPLMYEPGTRWHYSLSTDVLGRLVEVVSGQSFDEFLRERIFEPLGMVDTGFYVPASKWDRFTRSYIRRGPDGTLTAVDRGSFRQRPTRFSGGGGLVSTAHDYARFAQMLMNGGELDGARILGRKTVELMTVDHLPDGIPTSFLQPGWGFGLGFTVKNEAGMDGMPDPVGTYYWYGIRGTSFWVDPEEDLIGIFMIQIQTDPERPIRDITFRRQFKRLVYQAVID
ncbi:MAG: beta-lactamase family protein [Gemmatimonadetes bacterium]|nr:beta-lactamase family protein [Gemmatimonadota bacterium]